jgi:predicted DsbA family dithiol-disulfide isomerase
MTRRPRVVEVFADIVCPFTHVGLRRLVAARDARGANLVVRARAWPLEWVNGAPPAIDLVTAEIAALRASVAPDLFAGFDPARFPATTIPALGLAAAAYRLDARAGEAVSLDLRHALFEEGRDLTDPVELRAIGLRSGVEPLEGPAAAAAVRLDWERGRAQHVRGSPHFFVGEHDWFCPSLRISHVGDTFDVSFDPDALGEFYAVAFA